MAIGTQVPPSAQRRIFPRFTNRDRTTALLVKQDALVLETTVYGGWEEHFRPLIREVINALEAVSRPDGVLRVGLRYIDEIRVPSIDSSPGDWRGYIDEHLLAAADPDFIPASLQPSVWQEIVQYQTTTGSTLAIRYGPHEGTRWIPKGRHVVRTSLVQGCSSCLIQIRSGLAKKRCRSSQPTGFLGVVICSTSRLASSSRLPSPTNFGVRCLAKTRRRSNERN